jgi:hypothetical protein
LASEHIIVCLEEWRDWFSEGLTVAALENLARAIEGSDRQLLFAARGAPTHLTSEITTFDLKRLADKVTLFRMVSDPQGGRTYTRVDEKQA